MTKVKGRRKTRGKKGLSILPLQPDTLECSRKVEDTSNKRLIH